MKIRWLAPSPMIMSTLKNRRCRPSGSANADRWNKGQLPKSNTWWLNSSRLRRTASTTVASSAAR